MRYFFAWVVAAVFFGASYRLLVLLAVAVGLPLEMSFDEPFVSVRGFGKYATEDFIDHESTFLGYLAITVSLLLALYPAAACYRRRLRGAFTAQEAVLHRAWLLGTVAAIAWEIASRKIFGPIVSGTVPYVAGIADLLILGLIIRYTYRWWKVRYDRLKRYDTEP